VTAEEIVTFARQFDPQPFHVDAESAASSHFGGLIASGWHICALAMRMMCDDHILDSAGLGSPGADSIRLEAAPASGGHDHRRSNGPGSQTFEQPPGCWNSSLALGRQESARTLDRGAGDDGHDWLPINPGKRAPIFRGSRVQSPEPDHIISSWHYYMQQYDKLGMLGWKRGRLHGSA